MNPDSPSFPPGPEADTSSSFGQLGDPLPDLSPGKKEWRKKLKKKRKELSGKELAEISHRIFENWKNRFPLENVQYLHLFLSMSRFNEVHTQPFQDYIRQEAPQVKILVPVMSLLHNTLEHFELDDEIHIEKNAFGVPEPKVEKRPVSPQKIDMVIVPMLGFDRHGHRLGYGKGYYDRFLAQLRPDCPKIGICPELGRLQESIPSEPHDVPLDHIITEEKVYSFPRKM